jgi:hypothetical protein
MVAASGESMRTTVAAAAAAAAVVVICLTTAVRLPRLPVLLSRSRRLFSTTFSFGSLHDMSFIIYISLGAVSERGGKDGEEGLVECLQGCRPASQATCPRAIGVGREVDGLCLYCHLYRWGKADSHGNDGITGANGYSRRSGGRARPCMDTTEAGREGALEPKYLFWDGCR